eukprot:m51a1_g1188 hypothetical protein (479) ;mRNA; f:410197-413066
MGAALSASTGGTVPAQSMPRQVVTPDQLYLYEIKFHWARNVPQMDVSSASDCYVSVALPTGQEGRTRTANNTASPRWNERFRSSGALLPIRIELWDKDVGSRDDLIGHVVLTPADMPADHRDLRVMLAPGVEPSEAGPTFLCLSAGVVPAYHTLRRQLDQLGVEALADDDAQTLAVPFPGRDDALLGVSYVDSASGGQKLVLHVYETDELKAVWGKRVVTLLYDGCRDLKYYVRKVTAMTSAPLRCFGRYRVFADTRLEAVRLYHPFEHLVAMVVTDGDAAEYRFHATAMQVAIDNGWPGPTGFERAKTVLGPDVVFDDTERCAYLPAQGRAACLRLDWSRQTESVCRLIWYTFEANPGELSTVVVGDIHSAKPDDAASRRTHVVYTPGRRARSVMGRVVASRATVDAPPDWCALRDDISLSVVCTPPPAYADKRNHVRFLKVIPLRKAKDSLVHDSKNVIIEFDAAEERVVGRSGDV